MLAHRHCARRFFMANGNGNGNPLATSPAGDELSPAVSSSTSGTAGDTTGKIDRLARSAHQAIDQVADKAEPVRQRLHGSIDQAAAAVQSQADRLDRVQDEWLTALRDCVREHPIASVASALAAGMLLDRLLSSR
jgi:ElaB/YqjD/DUF883 family membrane-anchored ribosome-binding protein